MKKMILLLLLAPLALAAQKQILINNVQLFNGKDNNTENVNVLITDRMISKISKDPIPVNKSMQVTIIDGRQHFLMPGMIDAHWHSFMCANTMTDMLMGEQSFLFIRAAKESENTLLRGFTSVRDLAGPVFGIKKAIDMGIQPGPRIYPSGAMISQTSGHGDFRFITDPPRMSAKEIARPEALGAGIIADGYQEVLVATREQLRQGATQIKLAAGGGVASVYDPLETTQYSVEEMKAAVQAAGDFGTYVTVHVYTTEGVKRAVAAGVKCIDHGHLMDEECVKLLADKGIWLSMQPFDGQTNIYSDPKQAADSKKVGEGTANIYQWAKKYKVKLAWGTDLLFNPAGTKNQNQGILKLTSWFTNFEILKMITYDNAQLLALCGPRNPYPAGKLGLIAEGAYADMLLVDGDPLKDITVLGDPGKNLLLVIKDGNVYKNILPAP